MALFAKLRRTEKEQSISPEVAAGKRLYAIGDVHGRVDLLREIHAAILADTASFQGGKQVIYLGDVVDRGQESKQVIELLLNEPLSGFESIHLMGNHEYAVLNFLDDPESIPGWLSWGGRELLYSYGIMSGLNPSPVELRKLGRELKMTMPSEHVEFLESGHLCHQEGGYYFVHAGVRPGVALEKQRFEDQLYIREPFISSTKNHGAVIVHGHTISEQVELLPNRIGLDTGAYYSGVLSCLVLEGTEQRLLQTGSGQ